MPEVRNLHFQHTSPGISQHTWPEFHILSQLPSMQLCWREPCFGVYEEEKDKKKKKKKRTSTWVTSEKNLFLK